MRPLLAAIAIAIAAATLCAPQRAHAQLDARAVPTYESVGLYWTNPPIINQAAGCAVRFRRVGVGAYTDGLPLWFDPATTECRGSLVNLTPGTPYEAEISVVGVALASRILVFTTWANTVPVAQTVNVPSGSATLNITSGGSPAGYVVYQGAPGVLDAANGQPYNIHVNASYVVVRGFTLRGAQQHAIRIAHTVNNVIIEDNDISGWGRTRGGNLGMNADSGIYAYCGHAGAVLTRVTLQRNEIYSPRYTSNSWSDGHPTGPQGITMEQCPGNHVIRHNEIFSTNGNYFNDGISGSDNASTTGFPNADSDIYGNEVSNTWDDAIEVEGGNRNVRVWGNYLDRTGTGIASTLTSVGPLYLFRNVYNRSRFLGAVAPDSDNRQSMFKAGSDASFANGRRYVFHNTTLQAQAEGAGNGLGVSAGMGGTASTRPLRNTVTRNNIWHVWRPTSSAFYEVGPDNDLMRDMYSGNAGATIVNGIKATPTYRPGHGWQSESGGMYQLAAGTSGADQGVPIPNFNDGFLNGAPDIGAAEGGAAAMKFGIAASPGSIVGGGPPVGTALDVSPASVDFGSQSMLTRSPPQRVTVTNSSLLAVNVTGVSVTGPFTQTHDCGGLSAGESCAIDVVFVPPLAAGALNSQVAHSGTLTIASNDPGSPRNVGLAGVAEKSLVAHYYRSILRRAPDSGGKSFWQGESARMQQLGVDVNESWFALAQTFFTSGEYVAFNRDNAGFVTDLYNTFFTRAPDSGGLTHWVNQLNAGLPREVALASFMFSSEFASFTRSIFGDTSVRPEVNMVVDFYRGLLARLPDNGGFYFWLNRFRAAQCQGTAAVLNEVDAISSAFVSGLEYNQRSRNNAQFVGDLYNAFLRRGGDLGGVQFWINQLDTGARDRNHLRQAFQGSSEFSARVNAVASAGCA